MMEPINTSVDTNKVLSHDKHESFEQLHDDKLADHVEHVISKNYDVDDFLNLQKSPSNGLLDSYHESITPENVKSDLFRGENNSHETGESFPDDIIHEPVRSVNSETHEFSSDILDPPKNQPFCGTDKLNNLADYLMNDDVEEFIPSSSPKQSYSLLDFDPLNEPVHTSDHDEFILPKPDPPHGSHQLPDNDLIEPVVEFKETLPSETFVSSSPSLKNDKETSDKFKEIVDDSPRTGTPDFLELDSEDLKTTDVKTESIKPAEVKPIETKPLDAEPAESKPVDVKPLDSKPVEKVPEKAPEIKSKKNEVEFFHEKPEIGPKELFSKYGLVEAFIYWRDPKLSAVVFVSGLVLMLSMAYYSLISVVANTGLAILVLAMGFRVYKHGVQAVQKTDQGHPYSVFLEKDLKLPQEKVHELVDSVLIHINAYVNELKRLILIENWMESVRFAIVLWVLTYVGSWFNGLTLVILAFVSLFTLPKVYENNKVQIDQNFALVHAKLEELTNKIKDTLPALLRKKVPEKKE